MALGDRCPDLALRRPVAPKLCCKEASPLYTYGNVNTLVISEGGSPMIGLLSVLRRSAMIVEGQ